MQISSKFYSFLDIFIEFYECHPNWLTVYSRRNYLSKIVKKKEEITKQEGNDKKKFIGRVDLGSEFRKAVFDTPHWNLPVLPNLHHPTLKSSLRKYNKRELSAP